MKLHELRGCADVQTTIISDGDVAEVTVMRHCARLSVTAMLALLAAASVATASPGGGGHGGGGHFAGGYHGGYAGWRGGGYGWRGGYYGGWCCGWGWGWGFGLYLPLLPWYYSTYWWGGVPYYYADGSYYLWDGVAGGYQAVEPPAGLSPVPPQGASSSARGPAVSPELFAYPKGGQSEAQQKQDREECRRWATTQTGFDPAAAPSGGNNADGREGYLRAEAACLEGRNYSVR